MNKKLAIVLALSLVAIVCCAGCIDSQDPVDSVVLVDPVDPVTPVDPVVPDVEYSVFFMLNYDEAGAYTAETVTAGNAVEKPANPTRSGYTFKGWFTAAEGGAEYDFTQAVTADLTLYAQWKKVSSSSSGSSTPSHTHSYTYTSNDDGTHTKSCSCGEATEKCTFSGFVCTLCKYECDVYHIYNLEELKAFASLVNGGDPFSGKTVMLEADIDLGNTAWTPIGTAEKLFAGTFDGNGKTISNLAITGTECVGFFGDVVGTINNLKIDGAEVSGNHYVGAVAGYVYGEVSVCSVMNSKITATPNEVTTSSGTSYDNGDKVGGIVGYLAAEPSATLSGCSVTDTEVSGYRDVGGLVGMVNTGAHETQTASVTGNSVSGVTVTADQTGSESYAAKAPNAGAFVGRIDSEDAGKVTLSDNTGSAEIICKVDTNERAQKALDNAIPGTTIQLVSSVNYCTLYLRPVDGQANTKTSFNEGDNVVYTIYRNEYLRTVENITIIGADGATVDAIVVNSGHVEGTTCNLVVIKNLVIDSVEFTDKHTNSPQSYAAPIFVDLSYADVDGLTVKNCKLIGNNDKMNFVYFYSSRKVAFDNVASNIIITGNTVDGIARLCELRQTENVIITDNVIKNTALHGVLLAVFGGTYGGDITITGNTADSIGDRFVRMAGAGDANVVIKDNTITKYLGKNAYFIMVEGGTLTTEDNTITYGSTESVQAALDAAKEGTTIQLASGVEYGTLVFGQNADTKVVDITNAGGDAAGNEHYSKYKDITIIGAEGATVDQIEFKVGWIEGSGASYVYIDGLTIQGVTFSGKKTAINLEGSKGSALGIDGLTLTGCKMNDVDGGEDRFVFQQITGYKELKDKTTNEYVMTAGVKNLVITKCEITGAYQVIESRAMENLTITNNKFSGIKARDMLITSDTTNNPEVSYTGTITIAGNTADSSEERFVRAAGIGSATLIIKDNIITNYKGAGNDYIKVEGATGTVTISGNTATPADSNRNLTTNPVQQ